jgi:hypothetical protein
MRAAIIQIQMILIMLVTTALGKFRRNGGGGGKAILVYGAIGMMSGTSIHQMVKGWMLVHIIIMIEDGRIHLEETLPENEAGRIMTANPIATNPVMNITSPEYG